MTAATVRGRVMTLGGIAAGQIGGMLLAALTTKAIALAGGPSGVLAYSMLRQVADLAVLAGTVNAPQAVIRGVAARDGAARGDFLASVAVLAGFGLPIAGLVLWLAADRLGPLLFAAADAPAAVRWAIPLAFASALSLAAVAALNGVQAYRPVVLAQLAGAAAAALVAWPLAAHGAAVAYVALAATAPVVSAAVALAALGRRRAALLGPRRPRASRADLADFLRLAAPTLVMGVFGTAAAFAIRSLYIAEHGRTVAGWFDAASVIAGLLLGVALNALVVHALPRLTAAAADGAPALRQVFGEYLRIAALVGAAGALLLVAGRTVALWLLYSTEFLGAADLLLWFAIANYLRVPWIVFGVHWMATMDRRSLVGTEFFLQGLPVLAALLFLETSPLAVPVAAGVAHAVALVFGWRRFAGRFGAPVPAAAVAAWLAGLVLLGAVAAASAGVATPLAGLPWLAGAVLLLLPGTMVLARHLRRPSA